MSDAAPRFREAGCRSVTCRRSPCTTTSTAGCGRRRSSSWPSRSGIELPATEADALGDLVRREVRQRLARRVPQDLRRHDRGDADPRGSRAGRARVRRGPGRRRRRSTARSAGLPSSTSRAGSRSTRPSRRCRRASTQAIGCRALGRPRHPGRPAGQRHAPPRPRHRDRRARPAPPRPRRRRVRHRRTRGRLPGGPPARGVRPARRATASRRPCTRARPTGSRASAAR